MVKFIISYFRVFLIFLATFFSTCTFGQGLNTSARENSLFSDYFMSFCCFIIFISFLTEIIKPLFPKNKKPFNLILSWCVGVILSLAVHFLELGVFSDFTLSQSIATGFGATLASNGVFDSGIVTSIVKLFSNKTV